VVEPTLPRAGVIDHYTQGPSSAQWRVRGQSEHLRREKERWRKRKERDSERCRCLK